MHGLHLTKVTKNHTHQALLGGFWAVFGPFSEKMTKQTTELAKTLQEVGAHGKALLTKYGEEGRGASLDTLCETLSGFRGAVARRGRGAGGGEGSRGEAREAAGGEGGAWRQRHGDGRDDGRAARGAHRAAIVMGSLWWRVR